MSRDPIFIVGMPRSGTTLLTKLVNQHTNCALLYELWFFKQWEKEARCFDLSDDTQCLLFMQACFRSAFFVRSGTDPIAVAKRFLAHNERTPEQLFLCIINQFAQQNGRHRGGEKCPRYEQRIGDLFSYFPDANVIHLIRDPRAVYASLMDAPWGYDICRFCRRWNESCAIARSWQADKRVCIVRYEDVVQQPQESLQSICTAIHEKLLQGEECNDALVPEKSTFRHRSDWSKKHWENVRSDPYGEAVTRWQQRLPAGCRAYIEKHCSEHMNAFGYTVDEAHVNSINIQVLPYMFSVVGGLGKLRIVYDNVRYQTVFHVLVALRLMKFGWVRSLYCRYHGDYKQFTDSVMR